MRSATAFRMLWARCLTARFSSKVDIARFCGKARGETPRPQSERGVALIITLFTLLLLSVIGMGMLLSAGTEGTIDANYRDKQTSMFGAMAGLQEARDRIQPATLNITPPSALPNLAAANIIYIINPKSGETVAPWDPSNKYADTELCHENVLSLTPGASCTGLPSVSTWYTTYDNSLSAAGVWQNTNFGTPMDLKWVRIQLKGNNNTPVPVNGTGTDATQVCWDGIHQVLLPAGYDPNCIRFGMVQKVIVVDGGANYTSAPTVTIDAPAIASGVQATAHATIAPVTTAQVQSVAVTNGGTGYTAAPIVTFTGGGGSGAAAVATFVPPGAPVATASLSSAGTACYSSAPAVSFTGGGGAGATATATLAAAYSCIAGWTPNGNCPNHKNDTITGVSLTGGGGSGFSSTVVFNSAGNVATVTIQNPGTTYTSTPTAITGISGCGSLTFTATLGKRVQSISLTGGGSGYTSIPTVSLTGGTGTTATQPTGTATLGSPPANAGQVTSVTVTNGGSGYTSAPTVGFVSADGNGGSAAGTATIGTVFSKVDTIVVDNHGKGYSTIPNVQINGGGGTGASARAVLAGSANWGKIYLLTALAETKSGARSFLQMEAATPVTGFAPVAAMLFDGPNPSINNMPNSDQFVVDGHDQNSCHDSITDPPGPAIGGYDDPNASPATHSVQTIIDSLPRPDHYIGDGPTPSVQNAYGALGETLGTPTGLKAYIESIRAQKTNLGNTIDYGTAANPAINYISGDVGSPGTELEFAL